MKLLGSLILTIAMNFAVADDHLIQSTTVRIFENYGRLEILRPELLENVSTYSLRQYQDGAWGNPIQRDLFFDRYASTLRNGLHEISLGNNSLFSNLPGVKKGWKQQIYTPFNPQSLPESDKRRSLALTYRPILIFNQNEQYFPQSLDDILDFGADDQSIAIKVPTIDGPERLRMGEEIKDFLAHNGHADGYFDFGFCETTCEELLCLLCFEGRPLFLRDSTGSKDTSHAYYEISEEEERIYLTYHFFYAFDPKLGTRNNPDKAAHAFDRESFTIEFAKNSLEGIEGLEPKSVTYGAHLTEQEIRFRGCSAEGVTRDGILASWSGGRMKLPWDDVPKFGDQPIVFVAQGSHAIFPLPGWYGVDTPLFGEKLVEPAGITDRFEDIALRIEELDLRNPGFLAFSGAWVDIPGPNVENDGLLSILNPVRFPPFTKRAPYKHWVEEAEQPFKECLSDKDKTIDCVIINAFFDSAKNTGVFDKNDCNQAWLARLGDLPGGQYSSTAYGISGDGTTVVGESSSSKGSREAFVWKQETGIKGLGGLDNAPVVSRANGASKDGSIIVGTALSLLDEPVAYYDSSQDAYLTIYYEEEAFRYQGNGPMEPLGRLYHNLGSGARDVSENGRVVVGSNEFNFLPTQAEAFRWHELDGMVSLTHPDRQYTDAEAISADGTVIVVNTLELFKHDGSSPEAFIRTLAEGWRKVGGNSSVASGISADGTTVVGRTLDTNGGVEAFRWTSAGGTERLDVLPSGSWSEAYDVSADGRIVVGKAECNTCSGPGRTAFVWDPENRMRKLSDILAQYNVDLTGWQLSEATAISDDGLTIVGNTFSEAFIVYFTEPYW